LEARPGEFSSANGKCTMEDKIRRVCEPITCFRNNALDILKLMSEDNPEQAQACRNLLWQSYNLWYARLLRNVRQLVQDIQK